MVSLSPGSTFHGRYEVVRCLKAGGMGAIYEVIHLETRRRRALKVMLPEALASVDMRARFKLEATIAADIETEHIVETFDAGVDEETGAPFLVMELLRGEDLAAAVERRGKLPPLEVVELLSQVASALDKTHAAGVVHRDLKPDNLFVTRRDDGTPKVKILDFGIAKVVSEGGEPAAKTKVLGTPLYMSPEQVRGDGRIGPRADLYALAQIAFTLLVGKPYWAEEHEALSLYALMTRIVGGCQVPASDRAARYGGAATPAFDAWFRRATHVLPEERFGSAAAATLALAEALGVAAPEVRPEKPLSRRGGEGDGATQSLPTGAVGVLDHDTEVRSAPTSPTTTLRSGTDAPSSVSMAESPRRSPAGRSVAGVAIAALLLVAAAVVASRIAGRSPPALVSAASGGAASVAREGDADQGAAVPLPTVAPPAPRPPPSTEPTAATTSAPPAPTGSAREPAAAATSAPPAPITSARATARPASPRRAAPSAAAATATPSATAPAPESDAFPPRSLD